MSAPMTPLAHPRPRRMKHLRKVAVLAALTFGAWPLALSFAAPAPAPTSPGTFTGWAFDACAAPSAKTMDAWLKDKTNPYRGIGIYISGSLRACSQPNLTSAWVSHVQAKGWHLLPLTVGPQASCTGFSKVIKSKPANTYAAARKQAAAQADEAVASAQNLGIVPGSTLFYDMENWHTGYNDCDASTLWFISAWSNRLHAYGYAGGVYVSGSSGARLLNEMANNTPSGFVLPDHLWIAEWNNKENTKSNYVDATNWANHQRVHQYWGGHNATNSGITLNIDSNYVDLQPVSPIPAVVPDSAIGAISAPTPPSASPSPTPTTPTASVSASPSTKPSATPSTQPTKPAATPSTKPTSTTSAPVAAKPSSKPSAKPSTQAPAKPSTTPSTPAPTQKTTPTKPATTKPAATKPSPSKPATTKPAPSKPTTKASAKPQSTVKARKPVSRSAHARVNLTEGSGTAAGIQAPTRSSARALAPQLAERVPTMEAPVKAAAPKKPSAKTSAAPQAAKPSPSTQAPAPIAQAVPLQPDLPLAARPATAEPSLVTKIWNSAQDVLETIGGALAAAAGWVGRGFGSMLGW